MLAKTTCISWNISHQVGIRLNFDSVQGAADSVEFGKNVRWGTWPIIKEEHYPKPNERVHSEFSCNLISEVLAMQLYRRLRGQKVDRAKFKRYWLEKRGIIRTMTPALLSR